MRYKKKQLLAGYRQQQEQAKLKKEYGLESTSVVVVEKKNYVSQILRVLLSAIGTVVRIVAMIAVIVLAIIGIAALVYPEVRGPLVLILQRTVHEFLTYI